MTRYQRQFHRPLPSAYREIEVCAECDTPTVPGCSCPGGTQFMAVRKDGQELTCTDNWKLFPEKYNAVH